MSATRTLRSRINSSDSFKSPPLPAYEVTTLISLHQKSNSGIGTSTPARKLETSVDAVNGTYSVGLRVGTKGAAYSGSGGAIELASMNNDGTVKPVVVHRSRMR